MRITLLLLALTIEFAAIANQGKKAKIISVIDGNTVLAKFEDDEVFEILIAGVDAPELSQNYGEQAKGYLEKLVLKKKVEIDIEGKDRKGNRIGNVTLKDGTSVSTEMLSAGLAWNTEKEFDKWKTIEEQAKTSKQGVWSEDNPTPPWIYKRRMTMKTAKSG